MCNSGRTVYEKKEEENRPRKRISRIRPMHAARDLGLAEKVIQYIVYNTSKLSSDRITGEDGGQEDYGDTWVGTR